MITYIIILIGCFRKRFKHIFTNHSINIAICLYWVNLLTPKTLAYTKKLSRAGRAFIAAMPLICKNEPNL